MVSASKSRVTSIPSWQRRWKFGSPISLLSFSRAQPISPTMGKPVANGGRAAGEGSRPQSEIARLAVTGRFAAWKQDDDTTSRGPFASKAISERPIGRLQDQRLGIVKDTPGSLVILEVYLEVTE